MSATYEYDRLCDQFLKRKGVTLGRALNNDEALKVHGKIFAFRKGEQLIVKLPRERVQELLDSGAGAAFESGGRVMKEWVAVAHGGPSWPELAGAACDYVDPGPDAAEA